jgi:broad specificity phosphatase PhoE
MPEIEHRRHSWREPPGEHLTQKGVDLARRTGEAMGRFDLVVTSELPRAFETAIAMGYAVDRTEKILSASGEGTEAEIDWTLGCAEFARGYALGGATTRACRAQAEFLSTVAASLPPDGRALLVSHGGIIEEGVVGLLPEHPYDNWGPACERCEGVILRFDGDRCVGAEILRLPGEWQ